VPRLPFSSTRRPKFREHHHRDVVFATDAFDVFHEGAHRVGGVHEETAVQVRLLDVRVE